MALLAVLISLLIGAPVLVTVGVLVAAIPIGFLATIGVAAFKFNQISNFTDKQERRKKTNLTPSMRFRLRRTNPPWNRNMRAT